MKNQGFGLEIQDIHLAEVKWPTIVQILCYHCTVVIFNIIIALWPQNAKC